MDDPPLLDIDIRHKAVAGRPVLAGLQARVADGEAVCLLGAGGCGKSTLLHIVAGLDADYEGRVVLDGMPVRGLSRSAALVLPQPRLMPWLTVGENVAFDIGHTLRRRPAVAALVHTLLAEVGLAGLADAHPPALSAAQAQRAALARALFSSPRLLLIDEPFVTLARPERDALEALLAVLARRHQLTLLMASRDPDQACRLADRVWVLGGPPAELAADIALPQAHPRRSGDTAAVRDRLLQAMQALQSVTAG